MQPIVQVSQLSKTYSDTPILQQLDFSLAPGEIVAILGENGAGKTTLLQILLGLLSFEQGEVQVFGQNVSQLRRQMPLRAQIGVMLQQANLPANLTVLEQLSLFASYYPDPVALPQLIADCRLGSFVQQRYSSLSGGQKQAVLFAIALIGKPRLLFLDEPTVGLDVQARQAFWQQIRTVAASGVSIVLTTHYLEEADQLAQRILVLKQGRFIADTSPEQLKRLNSQRRIQCVSQLPLALVQNWPEVQFAEQLNADTAQPRLLIQSAAPEQTVRRLLELDPQLHDLTIQPFSLEQAFLQLTAPTETAA